jgi:hypothetical protein
MESDNTPIKNGFVYKWIYKPSGQYYIGIHQGTITDGYIGSGKRFKAKWNTTEEKDWQREILFEGEYYTECVALEEKLVNDKSLSDPLCLNLQTGGRIGERLRIFSSKTKSYRVKPQEITLDGIKYNSRMQAIKVLNISFEQLDAKLMASGWPCKYNDLNRH